MDVLTPLVHWLHLLALALWIGGLAVSRVVLSPRRTRPEDVPLLESARHRAQAVLWWSLIALIVTLAAEIGLRAAADAGGDSNGFMPSLKALLFGTRYGEASVARWLLVVASLWAVDAIGRAPAVAPALVPRPSRHALGIVAGGPRRRSMLSRGAWLRICILLAVALLAATAAAGPYGALGPAASLIDTLHLGATALWLGGAMALALIVAPFIMIVERERRPMALVSLLNRYSPLALLSVLVLVLTGWWELRQSPRALGILSASVDRALTLKLLLYVVLLIVSGWSAMVLRPRLRRLAPRLRRDDRVAGAADRALAAAQSLLWVDAALAAAVLLLVAADTISPVRAAAAAPNMLSARSGSITMTLRAVPDAAGANSFDLYLTNNGRPLMGADVALTATSMGRHAVSLPPMLAEDLGGGHYRAHGVLTTGGRWRLHMSLLRGMTVSGADVTLTAALSRRRPAAALAAPSGPGIWQPLGPNVIVHALVADPANHALLYEGTIAGVYRSSDGGLHWTPSSTGLFGSSREVWSLTFLPDGSLIAATGAGVYRSTDGAAHWRAVGLGDRSVYTLATHVAGHIVLLAGADGGIFRSDDLAASWHRIFNSGAAAITSLAWPSIRPTLIVAGISPADKPLAVSHDSGATWQTSADGLPPGPGLMSVAVAPGAHDAYAGSMGLGAYALPGLGGTWQGRNAGLPGLATGDAHIGSFSFDPRDSAVLYAATPFGVYRSGDAGRHWAIFGRGLYGDATVVTALMLVTGPHPTLYAATAAGLYRAPLAGAP